MGLFAGLDGVIGGGSDHSSVVGAELGLGEVDLMAVSESVGKMLTQDLIGGNSSSK